MRIFTKLIFNLLIVLVVSNKLHNFVYCQNQYEINNKAEYFQLDSIVNIDTKNVFIYNQDGKHIGTFIYEFDYFEQIWKNKLRKDFFYQNDKLVKEITFSYNKTFDDWMLVQNILTDYDKYGNIIYVEEQSFDNFTSEFSTKYKKLIKYDERINILNLEEYSWDFNLKKLIGKNFFTFLYNSDNQIIEKVKYIWDISLNNWDFFEKNVYKYENHIQTQDVFSIWEKGKNEWINRYKTEKLIMNNLIISNLYSSWNIAEGKWYLEEKNVRNFKLINDKQLITEELMYKYNKDDQELLTNKLIYSYNLNNIIDTIKIDKFDFDKELNNLKLKTESYIINNYPIKQIDTIVYSWYTKYDGFNNSYIDTIESYKIFSHKYTTINDITTYKFTDIYYGDSYSYGSLKLFKYDKYYNIILNQNSSIYNETEYIENIVETEFNYDISKDILFAPYYIFNTLNSYAINYNKFIGNQLTELYKDVYFYTKKEFTSVKPNFSSYNPLIFPNPSSDKISLDLGGVGVADLVIYDILGNEIMYIPNYSNKSDIDISNLSIGTYTIQVQTSTGSISQRFVKY